MASTCIIRRKGGEYLCGSESTKPTLVLARTAPLPNRLTEGGAPTVCPECAAAHTLRLAGATARWVAKLDGLLAQVRREVAGTRQGVDTLARYVDAVDYTLRHMHAA